MGEIIAVASGKGGVGKTTIAANTALALTGLGYSVVAVDTDLGLRNLDLALGMQNNVIFDIIDVANGDCNIDDALIKKDDYKDFAFLPASQFKDKELLTDEKYIDIIYSLKDKFDYVVVDCPAGIDNLLCRTAEVYDNILIVANPDPFSLRDADRTADILEKNGAKQISLIINRIRTEMVNKGIMQNISAVIEELGIKLIGIIPEDEIFIKSAIDGVPAICSKKSKSPNIIDIAKRITGIRIPITEIEKKGFMKRLFRR